MGIFLALLAAFSLRERGAKQAFELPPRDLVLLGLATYRAGRVAA